MLKVLFFNIGIAIVLFKVMQYIVYYYTYQKQLREIKERIIEIKELYEKFFKNELKNEKFFSKQQTVNGTQYCFQYRSTKEACLEFENTICDMLFFCYGLQIEKILPNEIEELEEILEEVQELRAHYGKSGK